MRKTGVVGGALGKGLGAVAEATAGMAYSAGRAMIKQGIKATGIFIKV